MPPKYFRSLLRLSAERFECSGQDNLICFTSWNQGKGLLYDVDKKAWSWIAGCALQSYNSQSTSYFVEVSKVAVGVGACCSALLSPISMVVVVLAGPDMVTSQKKKKTYLYQGLKEIPQP
ncbi:hypothetical protein GBA52_011561 [Prunus armeniaca]|nr:hypothetical protein GBA52_011561 [Prunus armeniaca]